MKRSAVGSAAAQNRQNIDWLPYRAMSIGTICAPAARSFACAHAGTVAVSR